MTLLIPSILATSAAGPAHLGPATIQEMSPPIFLAAVTACLVLCTGKSLSESLLFAEHGENMLCAEIVLNVKKNSEHVLSLEFLCIELVIQ